MALTKPALCKGPGASPSFCPVTQSHPPNPCGVHTPNGIVAGWTLGVGGFTSGLELETVCLLMVLVLMEDDQKDASGTSSSSSI